MNAVEEIFLGHLARPFGIKGELKLVPSQDFWEEVLESKMLVLRTPENGGHAERPFHPTHVRRQKQHYVVTVEGIGDRTEAESLTGGELFAPLENLDVAFPEVCLPFQVIGLSVVTEEGRLLGKVNDVLFTPGHDIYEVTGGEKTFLVPAVSEFVISIDMGERKIIIRPIPGLIEDTD